MKRTERKWMYERLDGCKKLRRDFIKGVNEFVEHAKKQDNQDIYRSDKHLKCPCQKCENQNCMNEFDVKEHLIKNGFCGNYYNWVFHGENCPESSAFIDPCQNMVIDELGDSVMDTVEESPHPQLKHFFDMLHIAEEPLYEGSKMSLLKSAARMVSLKSEFNLTYKCINDCTSCLLDLTPEKGTAAQTLNDSKKLIKELQLPHQKIDVCPKGCMLYWKEDALLIKCKKCGQDRYRERKNSKRKQIPRKVLYYFPITPRLQRLYAIKHIAGEMRWHAENPRVEGTMTHPSDGEAWKHFDATYPEFAEETRNVRLGLCMDEFVSFDEFGESHTCWPVMLTPYNLPPRLCMTKEFIFLSMIIRGPKSPKDNLDIYLQPLIYELKQLWETGVFTYDVSRKQNFLMKASLMWTINDFSTYDMLSGWSPAGRYACPYCMGNSKAFHLPNGNKMCWFDCHRQFLPPDHPFRQNKSDFFKDRVVNDIAPPRLLGHELWDQVKHFPTVVNGTDDDFKEFKKLGIGWFKQSIFWELPYWKTLLIRHSLDAMRIEKNNFELLINTVMNVKGKTADGIRSRKDLATFCNRPKLHVSKPGEMPKAPYTFDKAQKKMFCEWVCNLKFPNGYACDLSTRVDLKNLRLRGLNNKNCHLFMGWLLPVAMKDLLPTSVWNALTEISLFFRELCSSTIKVDDMTRLEGDIAQIICKLEKIFPPSYFGLMQHLPVHLPYEAKVGGPVQYRCMYPFVRYLDHLKRKVDCKPGVRGSLCNAYLTEEISNFCSLYCEEHIDTKSRDLGMGNKKLIDPNIPKPFQDHMGCPSAEGLDRYLDDKELERVHRCVLSNCELREYKSKFEKFIIERHPRLSSHDVWSKFKVEFSGWLRDHVLKMKDSDDVVRALALGPSKQVKSWKCYSINGFKFESYGSEKSKVAMNHAMYVRYEERHFLGILDEVIELSYTGAQDIYKTILFKCSWVDNTTEGLNIHPQYKLVKVNHTGKYPKYDLFVLACDVQQVCLAPYPSTGSDKNQWWAVFKTKARSHAPFDVTIFQENVLREPPVLSSVDDENKDEEGDEGEYVMEEVDDDELVERGTEIEEEKAEDMDDDDDYDYDYDNDDNDDDIDDPSTNVDDSSDEDSE